MSQLPPDEPVQPTHNEAPITAGPPNYSPPPAYGQPAYGQPPSYDPTPAYGPPAEYGSPPAYGQPPYGPPAYGQLGYGQPAATAPKRSRTIWIVAALVVVVLVAGIVAFAVTRKSGSGSTKAATATTTTANTNIATVTVPDGPGVIYRSSAGHFADRFPATPIEQSDNGSEGGVAYTIHLAADTSSHTVVEAAGFSAKLPASEQTTVLNEVVVGATGSSGLTAGAQSATTFQGHKAEQVELTGVDGIDIALLAFIYSDQRLYVLLAPAGDGIKNLAASFVAVA